MELYDVIIVGGGPAGLSAALVLARCRRNILLFDTGKPRNIYSDKMNGFLSRDGINPSEFISIARQDIAKYNVKWLKEEIIKGEKSGDVFKVRSANGKIFQSKKLLMATGIVDNLPPIEDIDKFYGKSIHHCPYCDGYENREKKIAIIGEGKSGIELTKTLSIWSKNLVFFTNGKNLEYKWKKIIVEMNIPVVSQKIIKCIGKDTQIEHLELENGEKIECNTVFLNTNPTQHCKLSDQFDCRLSKNNQVLVNKLQQTNIEGLYVSGDAAYDMKLVIIAAAEGAKAAVAINMALIKEHFDK